MYVKTLVAAFAMAFAFGQASLASVQNQFYQPGVTELEDQDYEVLLKNPNNGGGATVVEVDDLFAGVIKIQALNDKTNPLAPSVNLQGSTETITALFLIKVASSTGNGIVDGSPTTIDFAPATQAEWTSVFGAGGTFDISASFTPTLSSTGTMIFAFQGVEFDDANENAATTTAAFDSFVSGGELLYEFGLTGGADEFWKTFGTDADVTTTVTTTGAQNRFALDITKRHAGLPLREHDFLGTISPNNLVPDGNFTGPTHIQLTGGFQSGSAAFPIGTDSNLYLEAIPEPTTLAVWGGLIAMATAGLARVRQRD